MTDPKDYYPWPRSLLEDHELLTLLGSPGGRYSLEVKLVTAFKQFLRANHQHRGYSSPTREDFDLGGGKEILRIFDFLDDRKFNVIYYRAFNSAKLQLTEEDRKAND